MRQYLFIINWQTHRCRPVFELCLHQAYRDTTRTQMLRLIRIPVVFNYKTDTLQTIYSKQQYALFVCLRFHVPANNCSVLLGRLLGFNQYQTMGIKCLAQRHNTEPRMKSAPGEDRTRDLTIKSLTLSHSAIGAPATI